MRCLIDGCEQEAKSRGLCTNCYQLARLQVRANKVTWEQLEQMGLAVSSTHAGDSMSKFQRALNKATQPDAEVAEIARQQARDGEGCTINEFIETERETNGK